MLSSSSTIVTNILVNDVEVYCWVIVACGLHEKMLLSDQVELSEEMLKIMSRCITQTTAESLHLI